VTDRPLTPSALAAAIALAAATLPVAAHQPTDSPKGQERCYGVAKAGQNDCASLSGSHDCAGMAKKDLAVDEWKFVPAGSCKKLKGYSEAEARKKLKG
jgi:uncharacterized membrane protein